MQNLIFCTAHSYVELIDQYQKYKSEDQYQTSQFILFPECHPVDKYILAPQEQEDAARRILIENKSNVFVFSFSQVVFFTLLAGKKFKEIENMTLWFLDEIGSLMQIEVDSKGNLVRWPNGLFDTEEKILAKLFKNP